MYVAPIAAAAISAITWHVADNARGVKVRLPRAWPRENAFEWQIEKKKLLKNKYNYNTTKTRQM